MSLNALPHFPAKTSTHSISSYITHTEIWGTPYIRVLITLSFPKFYNSNISLILAVQTSSCFHWIPLFILHLFGFGKGAQH